MRLWSIHPSMLDVKGLVAAWREGLLAQKVLLGETKGYRYHSQLIRFKESASPLHSIGKYLWVIYEEATYRKYRFDGEKIIHPPTPVTKEILVTSNQIKYEYELIKFKLEKRDITKLEEIVSLKTVPIHPLFTETKGDIEIWEKTIPEIVERMK